MGVIPEAANGGYPGSRACAIDQQDDGVTALTGYNTPPSKNIFISRVTIVLKRFLLPTALVLFAAMSFSFIPNSPSISDASEQTAQQPADEVKKETPAEPFCGWSSKGSCQSDADCFTSGCSGEVCQSVNENVYNTICQSGDCYDSDLYNIRCGCVNNACQWTN